MVVHNVHDANNNGYMTDTEVSDMITDLNTYYSSYTPTIQFSLAKVDPNGYCHIGINHIETIEPYGSVNNPSIDVQLKNLARWDVDNYLNIWTVVDIL